MASHLRSHNSSHASQKQLRRSQLRKVLLETLERRELLAADAAGVVFAPGTDQAYVDEMIDFYAKGQNPAGEDDGYDGFNLQGSRWSNPVGGPSPNFGDPSVVTWSLVRDGTIDGTGGGSTPTNLIAFMDSIYGNGGATTIEDRPWFPIFERAYDRWSEVSGLTFVYEPNDDGAAIGGSNRGVSGVRGDVRIGGRNIDGNSGILAFNYFPTGGGNSGFDGDMIIDTNDSFYVNNADAPSGENRGLFNVLMHEAGHGIGLGHTIPVNQTKLLEPFISFAYLGAQHDDIRGANALYGDTLENNDSQGTATDLGQFFNGVRRFDDNSIDASSDSDWYKFNVLAGGKISVSVEPTGFVYSVGPQGGSASDVDSQSQQDLRFRILQSNGTVLADVDASGLGETESIDDLTLPAGGDYFIEVRGAGTSVQLYDMSLQLSGLINPNAEVVPPRLLSVAPNIGEIFSFNRTNILEEAPNELTFRFDGAQFLDASSIDGIRLTRSGKDGDFTDGDEVVIEPGWIGFGDSDRIIQMRFASTLPDDSYRIEVFGVDLPSEGITAVRNANGDALKPRIDGTDRDTLFFDLELGAQILAVVPQPTSVATDGTVTQARNQIEVYFNDDDLAESLVSTTGASSDPTVVTPEFYQLVLTADSVTPSDDVVFNPTSVTYDPDLDRAVLTFSDDIDVLAGGVGTFRLRVGSNEAVNSFANPPNVQSLNPGADPRGFLDGSFDLGPVGGNFSFSVTESLRNATTSLPLDFPGGNFEPGHRDIQDQNHLGGGPDASQFITQAFYNFSLEESYGVDTFGNPVFTSITPEQIQRVREIYEFYGAQLGIDFVESESQGMTVVVGDLNPNGAVSGPGGVLGVASLNDLNGLAIMDGAETWDNSLGGDFFGTALHEIGHMLGIGHTYELPPGTVMGSTDALASGNPLEEMYPGDHDAVHGRFLHRNDNKDVDLYRFEVPVGTSGELTVETLAERLANSSNADTHLTLLKDGANGLEVIATNDDYFSSDSYLKLTLDAGTYFIGVTTSGNEDFDAAADGTGAGGFSEGSYQLRVDFVPEVQSAIVDINGTLFDGDGDGQAGGNFNFWFRTATPSDGSASSDPKTIFVSKDYSGASNGSLTNPFGSIPEATAAARTGDIIRIVPTMGADPSDNPNGDPIRSAYEIGRGGVSNAVLDDGVSLEIPQGVTLMIDAGVLFKMGGSRVVAGSLNAGTDRSYSSVQVLGTPDESVIFTSYDDESLGVDTNPLPTTPESGQWGGIEIRNDIDRAEGRGSFERDGIFLNYVSNADLRYGGGKVTVSSGAPTVNPIYLSEARPTLLNNTIQFSEDSAISADPNSFEETLFTEPRFQLVGNFRSDYSRVGPDIRSNTLLDNTFNGLFVRVSTNAGQEIDVLRTQARFDDTDITHILGENLIIQGTPGGAFLETTAPDISLLELNDASGTLTPATSYSYKLTFVDLRGGESIPSTASSAFPTINGGVSLTKLPAATGDFVGRKLYRSEPGGGGDFTLIARLDGDTQSFVDTGDDLGSILSNPTAASLARARLDARLRIDPGIVVKSLGSRIEVGIGGQLIAEGTDEKEVIFTSRLDDRYGAGGTFDTNNDLSATEPAPGDWGGINARQFSKLSIDSAVITFGGGQTSVPGGFAGFNAVEVHQADARIANSTFTDNASGMSGNLNATRDGRGFHDASVIFVRGSQPVIINNVIRDNASSGTAAISIDANSLKAIPVQDTGRETGGSDILPGELGNMGPLVSGNRLALNGLNGMRVRGATLTTESVWDDTDIVHVLESNIIVPDFHTFGGLRLQSSVDESLVVKLGSGAGITADGLPLDITDRIGGSLQIIGSPGFPVVMTSISDDSVGAGFDPTGAAQTDTDSNGASNGNPGDWRGISLQPDSNDRNLATLTELESDSIQDVGVNDDALAAQSLGALAASMSGGDENLRLGFTLHGVVASPSDLDVYSFTGTAGTPIWIDIDRTDSSLDSVVELIDIDGNIIAQSDDSLSEAEAGNVEFFDSNAIPTGDVQTLNRSPFADPNSWSANGSADDFQSTNPADAGMRLVLPGNAGSQNTYYIRVRSSNVAPSSTDPNPPSDSLRDDSKLGDGRTQGAYRMQVRMQQTDEVAGSAVTYADIRYAQIGIEAIGLPGHSPLVGNSSELIGNGSVQDPVLFTSVGNVANSDRAEISLAGELEFDGDVDYYRFSVAHTEIQSGNPHVSTSFDIDYADGFGRPNTTLWLYRLTNDDTAELILTGTDSDISDDRAAPTENSDLDDFSRGSLGTKDAFIGAQELLPGEYIIAVTNNSLISRELEQFQLANPQNPLARLEPIDSIQRIAVDRFEGANFAETAVGPQTVAFSPNIANNHVPWTLADVTTFTVRNQGNGSRLFFTNAFTGTAEAQVGNDFGRVNDVAISPDGRLIGYQVSTTTFSTDANSDDFLLIDSAGDGTTTAVGASGIQTFTTEFPGGNPAVRQRTKNNAQVGDGLEFNALTFYSSAAQVDTANLRLFGVGQRGDGGFEFVRPTNPNDLANSGFVSTAGEATNFIYRLDPTTGAAINPAGLADRAGNFRTEGAGTQSREFGSFATADPTATITGIAQIGNLLAAVSEDGELFLVGAGSGTNFLGYNIPSVGVINDPLTGDPIEFTGLTAGPDNLEDGRFENILFGSTEDGTTYAFDFLGNLLPIFPGASVSISSNSGVGFGVSGFDFSPLDVNLWHLTNTRGNDAGHGRPNTHNNLRPNDQAGQNSLYFGFENAANDGGPRQDGDWDPIHSVYDNSYNLPGGAHGAIESNPLDLRGYSIGDEPTLYFNYYLQTQNDNSRFDDADNRMQDAFRVYATGENGQWILLSTNNSDRAGNFNSNQDEFDVGVSGYQDANGRALSVQEAFDSGDNGAPDSWRQVRASLAPFAGQESVKLRFEFSSGASFRTGNPLLGGVELTAVRGGLIDPADTFTVQTVDQAIAAVNTFEFDMGLVLEFPSGASIPDGSTLTVDGTDFVFSRTDGTGNNILFSPTDSPAQIAQAVGLKLGAILGATFSVHQDRGNVINVAGLTPGGVYGTSLAINPIVDEPGVTAGNVAVEITQASSAIEVRDAIRSSLALAFNPATESTNVDPWPVYSETLRLFKYEVTDAGPLKLPPFRIGDFFGVDAASGGLDRMDERAQANNFAGVFVDDIIVGLAERGEAVLETPTVNLQAGGMNNQLYRANTQYEVAGFAQNEIETGRYQLNIRTAADYGWTVAGDRLDVSGRPPGRSFDSNDRLTPSINVEINPLAAGSIPDGTTFTLSDGVDQLTFEFDVASGATDPASGVAQGNIAVSIAPNSSGIELASILSSVINSSTVQANLDISALVKPGSTTIELHGAAANTRAGSLDINVPGITAIQQGLDTVFGEDHGDSNRLRDQGIVVISSSTVSDSSGFGIVVDAAPRNAAGTPKPGSPIFYPTNNADSLAPGVVIVNNVLDSNNSGGILISGDAFQPNVNIGQDIARTSTVARIVNNSIFGTRSGDAGIRVNDGASPIILNNILSNTGTGINVTGAQGTLVLGANIYHNNGTNVTPAGTPESFRITTATSPFIDAANNNFYLAPGSQAIDSSLEALAELASLTQVKSSLGLPPSPTLAPDTDITGQNRIDDKSVNPPAGLGGNVFKDRGAFDRADADGLQAVLLSPLDNDSANVDRDRSSTYVRIQEGILDYFEILLLDDGTGPDNNTVSEDAVVLTENGRLLEPGIDYVFGYNTSSRTIRLTPLAGLWRSDSVYEITMNNRSGIRIAASDGVSITEGDTFEVVSGGTTFTFEFDSDGVVGSGATPVRYETTYTPYQVASQIMASIRTVGGGLGAYLQGDSTVMVTGASGVTGIAAANIGAISDVAGNALIANRASSLTQFTILMPEVVLDYGDAPGANSLTEQVNNGSRHALLPIDAPKLVLGAIADADINGVRSITATGDDNDSALVGSTIPGLQIGSSGPAVLTAPAPSAALDGEQIVITDPIFKTAIFELDTDGSLSGTGIEAIDISAATTADEVATAIAAAIETAVLQGKITALIPFAQGVQVNLGGTSEHVVDLTAAPSISRVAVGSFDLVLPTTGIADGQTITIQDGGLGLPITFEINDVSAGSVDPTITVGNVAVDVDLSVATAADVAQAFAGAINSAISAGTINLGTAVATGEEVRILGDDEDGVSFGGIFNSQSVAVPVTVSVIGSGILDAWFDWNADGDFNDNGERVVTDLPVLPGETTIMVSTPANAAIGYTTTRFRLSSGGNLMLSGVGIGGEVEDHLIEIVDGTPPVAVDDAYSVNEDEVLTVAAADGVLTGTGADTDAEGDTLNVRDEDPLTPGLQPVATTTNGTLELQADGSFVYTPDFDFFGTDTFVYNVEDDRLTSPIPATVTITVNPVNDTPTAFDDEITILEDEAIVRSGDDFTANDFEGTFGNPSQFNELPQTLEIVDASILSGVGGTVSVANNELSFTPPIHYNNEIDGPILIELTIRDGGVAGGDAMPLESKSTLTVNLTAVNDAPEFALAQNVIAPDEDAGPQTLPNFVSSFAPGPNEATDEGTGPAINFEDQQVSFTVSVLDPAAADLFLVLPAIDATGTLTYELNPDVTNVTPFPEIVVEVIAVDTGADVAPDVNTSAAQLFTISPTAVNDAPEFTIPLTVDSVEDQGLVTVPDFMTDIRTGPASALDEADQTLSIQIDADATAFTTFPQIDLTTGTLTYQTGPDVNSDTHNLEVVVTIRDDGGLPAEDTTIKTFTIVVDPINDAPSFDLPNLEVNVDEDNEDVTGNSPTVVPGFAANPVQGPVTAIDETTLPGTQQTLNFVVVSVSNPSLFAQQPTISSDGDLSFETADNQNGQSIVVVRLLDNGDGPETGEGDDNQARPDQTFTISLRAVNDPPEFTIPLTVDSIEDQGLVQVPNFATDLKPGPDSATDESGQEFTVTVIAQDPSAFTTQPSIAADGTLIYQTAPNVNRDNANLTVEVFLEDDGTAGPLPDNNTSPTQTFVIDVAPINDAPTFNLSTNQVTVIEDVEDFENIPEVTVDDFAIDLQPGPASATDENGQTFDFQVVSVSAPELFENQPQITVVTNAGGPSTGRLTFKTADNRNGNAFVVIRMTDSGAATPSPNDNDSALQTLTISISPINDAPQFSIPSGLIVDEDAGLVSRGSFATNVRRGPIGTDDENSQVINFAVRAANPSAFSVQPAIGPDGTLTFETAPNVNIDQTVFVKLVDNGASTPAPNANETAESSFLVTINPVNDDPIPDAFTLTRDEDQQITISAADVLVGDLAGPTDDELNQNLTMTQIERTSARGGLIQPVFNGNVIESFTYTPPRDLVGIDTFLYVVTDDGVPARSGTGTITIDLQGINDAPQFVKGFDQVVAEDSDTTVVENWATNILAGPPAATDEHASQVVNFNISFNNPSDADLFEVQPTITSSGTLSFKPAANANGTALVTVVAMDDGASNSPNVNVSAPQTFRIQINAVNDPPVFTAGGNVTIAEDSGSYSEVWATDVAAAAGLLLTPAQATDESTQVVDFTLDVDRPELFSVQPRINSVGQLQFTPSEDAFGIAVVTVTAVDRGPSGGLNDNTSDSQTFTIAINASNDAPVAVDDLYSANENSILTIDALGVLGNDNDVDLPDDTISVLGGEVETSLGAKVTLNTDGSFTYDPSAVQSIQQLTTGQSVLDTFTYQITDEAGAVSNTATVSINVTGIDDAPIAADDAYSIGVGQTRLLDVLSNDTDVDSAIDPRTIQIGSVPVFGSVTVNQTGVVQYVAGNGFRGTDTFTYTVRDVAGNVSNEALVTITVNSAPVAVNDSVFTFKNEPIDIDVLSNDSDSDGTPDPTSVQVVVNPTPSGSATVLPDGKIRFVPADGFAGQASFSYVFADDLGTSSNVANVSVRVQNSRWQNPQGALDVNADGFVTPIDALIVINYLNSGGVTELPDTGIAPPPFIDPNGDERVTPVDALLVINQLNSNSAGGGNGEGEGFDSVVTENYAMLVSPAQMFDIAAPIVAREIEQVLDQSRSEVLLESLVDEEQAEAEEGVFNFDDDEIVNALVCTHSAEQVSDSSDEAIEELFGSIYGPIRPK